MSPLELKKLKVEQARVVAARMELEMRIDEHKENIERLESSIVVQTAKEAELAEKIAAAEVK